MKFSDWEPDAIKNLHPEERHFAWLDHEARYHRDPVARKIISEIRMMLRPALFVEMQDSLALAYKAIGKFLED